MLELTIKQKNYILSGQIYEKKFIDYFDYQRFS